MSDLYFKSKRIFLSQAGDFLARLLGYSAYVVVVAVTLVLLLSQNARLIALGILFALFLADRAMHIGDGERNLVEIGRGKGNVGDALTPSSYRILSSAFRKSKGANVSFYLVLLELLVERDDICEILKRLDVKPEILLQKAAVAFDGKGKFSKESYLSVLGDLVSRAYENARSHNDVFIYPRNLFAGIFDVGDADLEKVFIASGIKKEDVESAVVFGKWRKIFGAPRFMPKIIGGFAHRPGFLRHRTMNRAWTARPTPTLDKFSTDLTDLARSEAVGFLIGHEKEYEELLQVIARPGKPNAILVGEAGAGKSTIIDHLAFSIIKDEVPEELFDKRLVSLEIGNLLGNATPEVLTARLNDITEEILLAGNIVLFVPNMHDLFRTSKETVNAIDIILPIVKSAAIPVIGETYPREFKTYIEPRSDFLEQFEVVRVDEISEEEAVKFLIYQSLLLERQYRVFVPFSVIKESVYLAKRYFHAKLLPGSAVDLLKQTLAEAVENKKKSISVQDVDMVAENLSRIPIQRVTADEALKLLGLEDVIHKKLIDQDAAVSAVARALREYRSGLSRKGGPIAAFLFVGPTGVGKTELSKILAEVQFGSKTAMQRFDMSEYQDKTSIFRLIGTPDGSKTGTLTDAVSDNPYTLVLLDEFEKAHPDVLNLFLQVFDDGRLTDSLGKTVDFQNTIIIATSNANSDFIKSEIEKGKRVEDIAGELKQKLSDFFRPELLNRFSDIVVFRDLKEDEIKKIAGLSVNELKEALGEDKGIDIVYDDAVLGELGRRGYDPVFGARPLRKVISDDIKSVLANKILDGSLGNGDTVTITFQNGAFDFQVSKG